MFAPEMKNCQVMRAFSLILQNNTNKIRVLKIRLLFCSADGEGLALFYVLVMMTAGGCDMKTFLVPLALLMLTTLFLTGCMQEDTFDSVKVDGDITTVFRTGSSPSHMSSRTRTGISF